ncbi:unnamed protein product, partial [marine sediment metagenome]
LSKSVDVTELQKKLQALLGDKPSAGRTSGKPGNGKPDGPQPGAKRAAARSSR